MKKNGFTLIEILVVIALLSIIALIAIPSVRKIYANIKEKEYDSKIELIETAAVFYAQDSITVYPSTVTINELLEEGYLKADLTYDNNICVIEAGCIISPVDSSIINSMNIEVTKNGTIVKAQVQSEQ